MKADCTNHYTVTVAEGMEAAGTHQTAAEWSDFYRRVLCESDRVLATPEYLPTDFSHVLVFFFSSLSGRVERSRVPIHWGENGGGA